MEIRVGCKLRYEMAASTAFVFQIEAAKADSQIVMSESLTLPAGSASDLYVDPVTLTRKVRTFLGPGPVEVVYEATVGVDASSPVASLGSSSRAQDLDSPQVALTMRTFRGRMGKDRPWTSDSTS